MNHKLTEKRLWRYRHKSDIATLFAILPHKISGINTDVGISTQNEICSNGITFSNKDGWITQKTGHRDLYDKKGCINVL